MTHYKIELQLFAEDAPAAETTPAEPKASEPAKDAKPESEKKYTDADVDKLIDQKFAEWQKKQEKAVNEAKKLAEMNAQQKAEYQRDELQKELDALKKKDALAEMTKTARKMLSENSINVPDELLALLVSTNAEETKTAVDGFAKVFKEALENAVKDRLKGAPPKRGSGNSSPVMTKEQIMAIRDPELRQKKMLENKELFNF